MADRPDIESIYHEARQTVDPAKRKAFLDRACGGDSALRARLEKLLAAEAGLGDFLKTSGDDISDIATQASGGHGPVQLSSSDMTVISDSSTAIGTIIGPYKLLQAIGEGGFGTVYLAEQEKPVRRRVALKIIKLGMDTKQVIARFEQERQALAIMDHPNIAKVFDAGATDTGRPYFVMELVKGVPITAYCDAHNLTPHDRMELFVSVCQAVQHAHQKGIIHRDIKPSNVLVSRHDDKPVVKVIDFGIAKATAARLTEKTVFTEFRQMIGTPAYMSPEQAGQSDLDIDTRTDVYSLGVLLYELLTGTTPFEIKTLLGAGYAEIQRVIREVEPPTPSSRLSTMKDELPSVAANRRTEPARLMKLVRGDLDWIVMKCLEKDRARRYETASGLAADIQRYITGEPVLAAPPSAGYKLRKFIRRNRASVTAGALVALVLIAGVIGTTWGMVWALRERDRADKSAAEALVARGEAQARSRDLEKVVAFQSAQLSGIDVMQMGVRLRQDMLNGIRQAAERTRAPGAATEASIAAADGALANVDLTGVARSAMESSIFKPSIDAIREQFVDQPKIRADLLMSVSDTARRLGALDIAERPGVEAVEIRTADLGPNDAKTLDARMYHALLLKDKGRLDDSDREFKECIALAVSTHGSSSEITMDLRANFAAVLAARAQFQDAADLYRIALPWYREHAGPLNQQTLGCLASLASALSTLGRFEEAEPLFRESVQGFRAAYGTSNMRTLQALNNFAGFYRARKNYGKAREVYDEALQAARKALGEDHWLTLMIVDNIGGVLYAQDHTKEAAEFARSALDARQRVLGANHPATLRSCFNLAKVIESQGKSDEAASLYRRAVEGFRGAYGEFHSYSISARTALSGLLINRARYHECADLLLGEFAQFDSHPEATKDRRHAVVRALGILYQKWDAAEPGKGYDAKAATWRAKLEIPNSQPTASQPANG